MTIIPFEKSHIDAVIKLQEHSFSDGWSKSQILSAFDGGRYFGFCAFLGEDLVGFIALSKGYDDCDLESIAVSREHRRKGIAELLIKSAMEKVKEFGPMAVLLEVRETNAPAIGLYEKVGFEKISVRKKYYSDGENAVVMKKEL